MIIILIARLGAEALALEISQIDGWLGCTVGLIVAYWKLIVSFSRCSVSVVCILLPLMIAQSRELLWCVAFDLRLWYVYIVIINMTMLEHLLVVHGNFLTDFTAINFSLKNVVIYVGSPWIYKHICRQP